MCTGDHGRAWLRYKGGGSPFESSDFGRKGKEEEEKEALG